MRFQIANLIGTGWDQMAALLMIVTGVSTLVTAVVIAWLRLRLSQFFVTRPDHADLSERLAREHQENSNRLKNLESQHGMLATKHSLANIAQQQTSLGERVVKVEALIGRVDEKVDGVSKSGDRVEHMMTMVLDHMISRDTP